MKILVINRQCNFSTISASKERPDWFSRESCFNTVYEEVAQDAEADLKVFFDGQPKEEHFINKYDVDLVKEDCGSGSLSYLKAIELALNSGYEYVYFVEDDYMHKQGWLRVLREGLKTKGDYITLYDHRDKYSEMYKDLVSSVLVTPSTHWRSVPSTTDTYACSIDVLREDLQTHVKYSTIAHYSLDHHRFMELGQKGRTIISSIPGWSTHVETSLMSPTVDWSIV